MSCRDCWRGNRDGKSGLGLCLVLPAQRFASARDRSGHRPGGTTFQAQVLTVARALSPGRHHDDRGAPDRPRNGGRAEVQPAVDPRHSRGGIPSWPTSTLRIDPTLIKPPCSSGTSIASSKNGRPEKSEARAKTREVASDKGQVSRTRKSDQAGLTRRTRSSRRSPEREAEILNPLVFRKTNGS